MSGIHQVFCFTWPNGMMMISVYVSEVPLIKVSIQDQKNHVSANVNAER